ncbi:MAG: phosphohydrolase [Opitutae bacterium]|nr:phosphohydrolase [Opitutae bacterium]
MKNPPRRHTCSLVATIAVLRARRALGGLNPFRAPPPPAAPDWRDWPDTRLCREALELTREISPPALTNHCLRAYWFGKTIARTDGLRYDAELLFLACAMHDWGLTERCAGPEDFEVRGADAAHAHLCARGCEPERAAVVRDAIAWHTAVGLAAARGPEQALTHFGSGMDVAGLRREALPPGFIATVVAAAPRLGFKAALTGWLTEEARGHPDSNFAQMMRLGFAGRIAAAPFAE